jgi:hypothetical protein
LVCTFYKTSIVVKIVTVWHIVHFAILY